MATTTETISRSTLSLLAGSALAASCTLPGFEDPQLSAEAFLTVYEFSGRTEMASPGTPVAQANPAQNLNDFGHDETDDGWGARIAVGDGFSGLQAQIIQVDNLTTDRGTLIADYGVLPVGSEVATAIDLLELELGYIGKLYEHDFELYDEDLTFRIGAGGSLVHRQLRFVAEEVATDIPQQNALDENLLPYVRVRARGDYRNVGLQFDFGLNPDIDLGDEFEGVQTDFEARLDYTFEAQNVTLFASWRRVELEGRAVEDGLPFAHEFALQGFMLGARVTF